MFFFCFVGRNSWRNFWIFYRWKRRRCCLSIYFCWWWWFWLVGRFINLRRGFLAVGFWGGRGLLLIGFSRGRISGGIIGGLGFSDRIGLSRGGLSGIRHFCVNLVLVCVRIGGWFMLLSVCWFFGLVWISRFRLCRFYGWDRRSGRGFGCRRGVILSWIGRFSRGGRGWGVGRWVWFWGISIFSCWDFWVWRWVVVDRFFDRGT